MPCASHCRSLASRSRRQRGNRRRRGRGFKSSAVDAKPWRAYARSCQLRAFSRLRSANSVASVRVAYLEPTPTEAIAAQSNVIGAVPATYVELRALSIVSWMSSH